MYGLDVTTSSSIDSPAEGTSAAVLKVDVIGYELFVNRGPVQSLKKSMESLILTSMGFESVPWRATLCN